MYSLTLVRKCYRIGVDAAILMNSTIPPPACFDEITGWKYRQDAGTESEISFFIKTEREESPPLTHYYFSFLFVCFL